MLHHNIINKCSSKDRLVKQIIQEQRVHKTTKPPSRESEDISRRIKLEAAVIMKKSKWKKTVKYKVQNQIQERVEKEMENKIKLRTVREGNREI